MVRIGKKKSLIILKHVLHEEDAGMKLKNLKNLKNLKILKNRLFHNSKVLLMNFNTI